MYIYIYIYILCIYILCIYIYIYIYIYLLIILCMFKCICVFEAWFPVSHVSNQVNHIGFSIEYRIIYFFISQLLTNF